MASERIDMWLDGRFIFQLPPALGDWLAGRFMWLAGRFILEQLPALGAAEPSLGAAGLSTNAYPRFREDDMSKQK